MGPENISDRHSLEIAAIHLESLIKQKKKEIAELEKARDDLIRFARTGHQIATVVPRTPTKRLRRGVPAMLIREAFKQYKHLSIPDLREKVRQSKDVDLKDSTTRRAIEQLEKERFIALGSDGLYHLMKEDDDDLPF